MWDKNLENAVLTNNGELAKRLIDQGVDPHVVNPDHTYSNLFSYAIHQGKKEAVLGMLSSQKFKFTQPVSLAFAVSAAALGGWCDLIPTLLEKPREPGITLEESHSTLRYSALHHAIMGYCSPDIARLLVDHGGNPNRVVYDGQTPLEYAVRLGFSEVALGMITSKAFVFTPETERPLADAKRMAIYTNDNRIELALLAAKQETLQKVFLLRQAVETGNLEEAKNVIAAGANVNEVKEGDPFPSLLHLALSKKDAPMVQLLIEKGADGNYAQNMTEGGVEQTGTPLSYAILQGQIESAKSIITSPHFRFTYESGLAVLTAMRKNHLDIVRLLLEKHDPADSRTALDRWHSPAENGEGSQTALYFAVTLGSEEAVRLLLAGGSDPHFSPGRSVFSPFTRAVLDHKAAILSLLMGSKKFNGNIDLVLDILDKSTAPTAASLADPLIQHDKGMLLTTVIKKEYENALQILLSKGLDPNQTVTIDGKSWTPLIQAIYDRKFEMACLMVKSPGFVYNSPGGKAAWVAAKAVGCVEECKSLITLLDKKKSVYEEDLLWSSFDDDNSTTAITVTSTIAAPSAVKTVNTQRLDEEQDSLYQQNGLYSL